MVWRFDILSFESMAMGADAFVLIHMVSYSVLASFVLPSQSGNTAQFRSWLLEQMTPCFPKWRQNLGIWKLSKSSGSSYRNFQASSLC